MVAANRYDSNVWTAGSTTSWAREDQPRGNDDHGQSEEAWRDLDRQLRSVAARRAALDAEELALIRKAIAIQIWRPLGMTPMRARGCPRSRPRSTRASCPTAQFAS